MNDFSHTDIQTVTKRLVAQAASTKPPCGEALEEACQLILGLDEENQKLRDRIVSLEHKRAICVSDLFLVPLDVTEASKNLLHAENAFLLREHILHNLADGITVQDRDFNIIYQNDAMQQVFGSHLGEKCYVCYEKRTEMCEGCGVAKAIRTGEATLVLRAAASADGTTSFWENACFPIFDKDKNVIAGVEVCRNVTTRVSLEQEVKDRNIQLGQLNEQLKRQTDQLLEALHQREEAEEELKLEMERRQQAEMQLRQANKLEAVGQLAAGISHEINTPTQFVGDNLNFLRSGYDDFRIILAKYKQALGTFTAAPGHEETVKAIVEAEQDIDLGYLEQSIPAAFDDAFDGVSRISRIVRAMKDFAHPDRREKTPADLNHALTTTLTVAGNLFNNIANVETDLGPLPQVFCHVGDLNQVFLNLLMNAAHAVAEVVAKTGEKGRVRIRTRHEGKNVRIEIEDTGCGIPSEYRERIFDPFFTTKEVGRGSGQGLAIAYSIVVDKHGGSLTFKSEVDKGTTFTILLPVRPNHLPPAPPKLN